MRVQFPECGFEVAVGSLLTYLQSQHVIGPGDQGGDPPPGGPHLPDILPKIYVAALVTSRGVHGWGFKSDQPPGSLSAPPHAVYNRDPGGG